MRRAYALIAYRTAWFKANHPVEFLAASMTLDKCNTDKLAEFRAEAERLGIKVEPPSVNGSGVDFDVRMSADGAPTIRYALVRDQGRRRGAGRGAGRGARAGAPSLRSAKWRARLDPRAVNKKALESLAAAGAFDEIEPDRAIAFAAIEPMLAIANRGVDERAAGQNALFGESEAAAVASARRAMVGERSGCGANSTRSASSSPAIRSKPMTPRCKRLRVARWADFARAVRAARSPRGSPPACSTATSGARKAAPRWASCSSPTRAGNMRRSCFRRASISFATCWKRARTCW